MPSASAVVDEPAHLTAGYLALTQRDLTVNREHPPLVKALAALPLLFMHPAVPQEPVGGPPRSSEDYEFAASREFLYRLNDADRLLYAARLPIVALTLGCGAILFLWGRAMFGGTAGLAALALYSFEPNLLAHGRLVTTDMGAALFTLATLACLERALAPGTRRGGGWIVACGACLGLGMASRYSVALLIPPLAMALALDPRSPSWRVRGSRLIVIISTAVLTVSLCYAGWTGSLTLFPLAADPVGGPFQTEPLRSMETGALLRWTPIPLPRLYLEGLDLARHKNAEVEGPGYLNGQYSRRGWWSYFILALGMKTTLPFLTLAAPGLALIAFGARRIARAIPFAYVLAPAAGLVALTTALTSAQIGLRYVLPVLPLLCLAGGWLLAEIWRLGRFAGRAVGIALLLWHAWSALAIHPYHLAYFNEAAGGPDRGYLHLVDSNLDWGQDLPGLREFMKERGLSRINLYYFGTADPDYYGIERAVPPEPGYYAVSATHLMGVYLPQRDYLAPFRSMRPETTIGHSILIYHLEEVPAFLRVPIRRH
ncbi:MAG TPA: glycosyltransferase family 39 protein [Candidatus Polarisedimenticolia bacterium]